MNEYRFNYHNIKEIRRDCQKNGFNLRFSTELNPLNDSYIIAGISVPNRLAILPMEGYDGNARGEPGELTLRRYGRYARGKAGLIWVEAVAVLQEGRSNIRQLVLTESNLPGFIRLIKEIKENAAARFGSEHRPYCVIQLTHSGRFSKPYGTKKPVIAVHDQLMDEMVEIDQTYPLLTDEQLKIIQEAYVKGARLAYKAGFDAVDIKACHKYLISELLGARTRSGCYGGSYDNRTRFLKETLRIIREQVPGISLAVRLNMTDLINTENFWGVESGTEEPDLTEPLRLVKELMEIGVKLLSISAGTPYYNPHTMRPFEKPVQDGYEQPEHPLKGVERLFKLSAVVQQKFPQLAVVGGGYSWLRQFGGNAAAWNIGHKNSTFAGFGRQAFAYPSFALDLLERRGMEESKCCLTCSRCSQLMIWGSKTGCVVRDQKIYSNIYKEAYRASTEVKKQK